MGPCLLSRGFNFRKAKWLWISLELGLNFNDPTKRMSREGVEAVTKVSLHSMRQVCILSDMNEVIPELDRLEQLIWPPYASMPKSQAHEIASALTHFMARLQDEVKSQFFFHLDQRDVPFFLEENTPKKFDWAREDMSEAGKCLALQRPTACVFHLMRALEHAVQRLGKKLKVEIDVSTESWHQICLHINKQTEGLPKNTVAQRNKKIAYAAAASHLTSVRIAWRNEVMHPKQTYTREEAFEIFTATKAFMASLEKVL